MELIAGEPPPPPPPLLLPPIGPAEWRREQDLRLQLEWQSEWRCIYYNYNVDIKRRAGGFIAGEVRRGERSARRRRIGALRPVRLAGGAMSGWLIIIMIITAAATTTTTTMTIKFENLIELAGRQLEPGAD